MTNARITLVQTVANIQKFQEMLEEQKLPLVICLSEEEQKLYLNKKTSTASLLNIVSLYSCAKSWKNSNGEAYCLIKDWKLRELIEEKKIYIPDFIDLDGITKYVDYIQADTSYSLNFLGGQIIFRDKKRLFEKNQATYSLKRNRMDFFLQLKNVNCEDIHTLCFRAIEQQKEKSKRKELSNLG